MTDSFIPTINISPLLQNELESNKSKKVLKQIESACINVGFFQVIGHGINPSEIKKLTILGNKFFNFERKKKFLLAPKKWNKKNKHLYRGYFPSKVNGKEGLDIGDLKVTRRYSNCLKNQYIEHLDLKKCFDSKSIKLLSNYFDEIFSLSELLFKGIIKLYNKNPDLSKLAFSRLKTLSTLRFNYYPKQK